MADAKISAFPAATVPLAGTEVLPVVQSGVTDKVAVSNLTAGRAVSALSLALGTPTSALGVLTLAGSTSGTVTVQSAAAAGTWTFTLPITGDTNGYALTTNGSGVGTWTALFDPTAPGAIGGGTPSTGAFTTLAASSTVSGLSVLQYFIARHEIRTDPAKAKKVMTISLVIQGLPLVWDGVQAAK